MKCKNVPIISLFHYSIKLYHTVLKGLFVAFTLTSSSVFASEYIRVVGSSTLYPFIAVVAEQYAKKTGYHVPIVEATGTGGGINLFCMHDQYHPPNIVGASRAIKKQEIERCKANGRENIKGMIIGYDGIVLASMASPEYNFDFRILFLAMSKKIPLNGQLVDNFYIRWSEIDSSLPNNKIEIYGPSFSSGTRDSFIEIVSEYCLNDATYKKIYPRKKDRKFACKMIRKDNAYLNMGDNDNIIINKIIQNTTAVGIISFNYYEENKSKIKAASIKQVLPTKKNILNNTYPLSRPFYVYFNESKMSDDMYAKFIDEFTSEDAIGEYGYLKQKGFLVK